MKTLPRLVFVMTTIVLLSMCAVTFAQEPTEAGTSTAIKTQATPEPEAAISETAAPATTSPTDQAVQLPIPVPAKFVVLLPERVDLMWCWYYYTDVRQYFVQSAVERALINAGKEIVDLTTCDAFQAGGVITEITNPAEAIKKAAALGATYAVIGQADAVKASENIAYGVTVVRANANASARILRVKDGKMLAMEEATAQGSGQSVQSATQDALKNVGRILASKITAAATRIETTP